MARILVVDDESAIRDSLRMILEYEGYKVAEAQDALKAIDAVEAGGLDLCLLDIKMSGMDGMEALVEIRALDPDLPVVMISGHGTIQNAVEATRKGAFDFIEKPFDRERLLLVIRNGLALERLSQENRKIRERTAVAPRLVGESAAIREVKKAVERVAPSPARVLITGENGTGKEVVAREIHGRSPRASERFVEVNCAAIPSELIESELFGHEKGAFTGASSRKLGKFELADGGTLFLDEIGDMSLAAQAKVLRALETNRIERVGGNEPAQVDVRVIAATNKNLDEEVQRKMFRQDLLFRLNVVTIHVPPLRERKDDIPLLVRHFADQLAREYRRPPLTMAADALERLSRHHWPGNVRELKNAVERMVIFATGDRLGAGDVPPFSAAPAQEGEETGVGSAPAGTYEGFKEASERKFILEKLQEFNWNVSRTAEAIEMPRSNLYKKIERYGLKREEG